MRTRDAATLDTGLRDEAAVARPLRVLIPLIQDDLTQGRRPPNGPPCRTTERPARSC